MIVLDTNVVSEPWRPHPEPRVVAWLDAQHVETLYLTTITLAELRNGIAALPDGRRRQTLDERLESEMLPLFADRILAFDEAAAAHFARTQHRARTSGRPTGAMDGLIAAVCASRGFALATRNVTDFAGSGIDLLDPWTA